MTSDALMVVRLLFSIVWKMFTSWNIPGTNTTPAEFGLFLVVAVMSIRFIRRITFEHVRSDDTGDVK